MNETKNIVMLPIEKLYHHPNNRKKMGDLTELTESIRLNGVLQNLLVVPYSPVDHPELVVSDNFDSYVVVIGNRRLDAAKAAGMTHLPCEIAAMSLKDQVKAMAQENLLRKNPTVREQAENFQLLIDFGDSVQEVSDTTGFSTTTVRNRLKLNQLPKDKLDEAEDRGGVTMQDYMTIAEFAEHPDLQEMLLDAAGTKDFTNRVSSARTTVKNREIIAKAIAVLKTFATEITEADDTMAYQWNYSHWYKKEVEVPADAGTVKYFYRIGREQVDFYRAKAAKSEQDLKTIAFQRLEDKAKYAQKELEEASLRAFENRMKFIFSLGSRKAKAHLADIVAFWGRYCMDQGALNPTWSFIHLPKADHFSLAECLGIPKEDVDCSGNRISADAWQAAVDRVPEYALLCYLYLAIENNKLSYASTSWTAVAGYTKSVYVSHYKENADLDIIYGLLETLGYKLSEEEVQLKNGSHALFYKAEDYQLITAPNSDPGTASESDN